MPKRSPVRQTTVLIIACLGFLTGLAIAKTGFGVSLLCLLPLILMLVVSWKKKKITVVILAFLCMLILGCFRGQNFLLRVAEYDYWNEEKIQIQATVDNDAQYNDKKQLTFDVTRITVIDPEEDDLVGKIRVSGFGENAVYKGDKVTVSGKLFKTRGSRQASISYADIEVTERNHSFVDRTRRNFSAGISNVLPDPQAPFGLGLLIGERTTLDTGVASWLAVVGLTHIIAVSGYNLTIIIRFIHRLFGKHSRYQTVIFSIIVIGMFLLLTGLSASIVRASIVCMFSLVAWYYGRRLRPLLLLLLTACLTAAWYPIYLWSDIGWYLSFLAFFGVLIVGPFVTILVCKRRPKAVTQAVIESFSAQIMTLPLILYIFNQLSLIALVSNVLVVPLVPLAMLFTLVAGLAGMINPVGLFVLAIPARIILSYILSLVNLLAHVPNASISAEISTITMVWAYLIIMVILLFGWQRNKSKRAIITDEILI